MNKTDKNGDPIPSLGQKLVWRLEVLAYDVIKLLMAPFSFAAVSAFGGALLRRIGPLTRKHKIAETGMRIAFPDASDAKIKDWLTQSWDNIGRTFAEFPIMHRLKVFEEDGDVEFIGLDKIEALKDSGGAAVFVGGHFANWEVLGMTLARCGLPMQITYRKVNNPYMDARIQAERKAYGVQLLVPKSGPAGAKILMQALAAGESIGIMNDQKFNEGIEVPFFGQPAMTAPGPTRLALRGKVPLVPMNVRRVPNPKPGKKFGSAKFVIEVFDPIPLGGTGDRHSDIRDGVLKVTAFIEDEIRKSPQDWFWVHRRWPKSLYKDKMKSG